MANLSGAGVVGSVDLYSSETVQAQALGQKIEDGFSRKYRYVKVGGTALVVGNVLQAPARDVQFTDMAVLTGALGSKTVTLTNGTTTTTTDMFKGGDLVVSVTPGIGQILKIAGNNVATSGATLTITLEDSIRVALTTSSKVTLHLNDYNGVIVSPTTRTAKTVGVAIYPIAASSFGWIQTGGPSAALSDATVAALGEGLSPSTSTAGCTTKQVTLLENIGTASMLQVSGKVESIWLMID
jgi:hypothetical protein